MALVMLCVALALLKTLVIVLSLALGLVLLVALIRRPREVLQGLLTLGLLGLANARPLLVAVCIAAVALSAALAVRWRGRRSVIPTRPTDSRERPLNEVKRLTSARRHRGGL